MTEFASNKTYMNGKLSKGERKGWQDCSNYEAVPINSLKWESRKVKVYQRNRYGLPKLVP